MASEPMSFRTIASAASIALFAGYVLGYLATPMSLLAPDALLLAIMLLVSTAMSIVAMPIGVALVRRGEATFRSAVVAGAFLGFTGAVLGVWVADCFWQDCTFGKCGNDPTEMGIYGVPFGVMTSCIFLMVLRDRYPKHFGADNRITAKKVLFKLSITWLCLLTFGWALVLTVFPGDQYMGGCW